MTLEDGEIIKQVQLLMNKMGIGEALKKLLLEAQHQERITCGIYESAQYLEQNPDNVMICILPDIATEPDVSLNIHFTLIEAFCWENDIHLIKIDCADKLSKLFPGTTNFAKTSPVNDNDVALGRTTVIDYNCLLVQYPSESASKAEQDVVEFCKSTADLVPYPIVELPV